MAMRFVYGPRATRDVHVVLTGPQRDALIALTYNIGVEGFRTSTVRSPLSH
jgi:GH24 family phage-related lysozyme (muramidase)